MTYFGPATPNQINFIRDLLGSRVIDADVRSDIEARLADGTLDKSRASHAIDRLRLAPKASASKPESAKADLEEGVYRKDGVIFRVHRSRESGKVYAKRLDFDLFGGSKPRFVYAKGAITTLAPTHKMSKDEAKAFGVETGICCVCGAFLTDAKSVAEGIGPVCAKGF
jgi:hypothetical protein